MAKICIDFLGPIGLEAREMEVKNLADLKEKLQKMQELQEWLKLCAIAVNDEIIEDLHYVFQDNDKVVLLPPVCGG